MAKLSHKKMVFMPVTRSEITGWLLSPGPDNLTALLPQSTETLLLFKEYWDKVLKEAPVWSVLHRYIMISSELGSGKAVNITETEERKSAKICGLFLPTKKKKKRERGQREREKGDMNNIWIS